MKLPKIPAVPAVRMPMVYKPGPSAPQGPGGAMKIKDSTEWLDAKVAKVYTHRIVDLLVKDHAGVEHLVRFVPLLRDFDPNPTSPTGICRHVEQRDVVPPSSPDDFYDAGLALQEYEGRPDRFRFRFREEVIETTVFGLTVRIIGGRPCAPIDEVRLAVGRDSQTIGSADVGSLDKILNP